MSVANRKLKERVLRLLDSESREVDMALCLLTDSILHIEKNIILGVGCDPSDTAWFGLAKLLVDKRLCKVTEECN